MSNILKAIIDVSAPGAKEAFSEVGDAASKVNAELKKLGAEGKLSSAGS